MIYDLAVVGAGPAGSSTAVAAAKAGLSVLLLEKKNVGRDKYCGGGITVLARKYLKDIGASEVEEVFERFSEGHVLILPGEKILIDAIKGHGYYLVRRSKFDGKLMEIVQSLGAQFKPETEVNGINVEGGKVLISGRKGEKYEARYVVVATGADDRIPVSMGFPKRGKEGLGHCWGTEAPYDVDAQIKKWRSEYGFTPLFFIFGILTYGYFWIFPKAGHMNVGMGTTLEESAKYGELHLKGYAKGLEAAKKLGILDNIKPFKVNMSWIIPGRPREKTYSVKKRALLVGDAAGFVYPLTGEGISGSICSGMLAAQTVKKALDSEDPGRLAEYEKLWWNEFGEEMFVYGVKLTQLMYSSPLAQKMGLYSIMNDEKAVKLLSTLLYRADKGAGEKLYKYIVRQMPLMILKALKPAKRRNYSDLS